METKTITIEDLELIQDAIEKSIVNLKLIAIKHPANPEELAKHIIDILQEANDTIEYVSL